MATKVDAAFASLERNLLEKTGKTIEAWIALARTSGKAKHGELVKWLKAEHGLTHGYAARVAQRTLTAQAGGGDALVDAQYAGKRAGLRPIHDALVAAAKKLGKDVEIAPKKTGVSLRRSKQFALIQPATNTRVDLGLQLKGIAVGGRTEAWPNPMCTHRVRLEAASEIDKEVLALLKQAYSKA